jgi:Holliday junction resolvase
MPNRNYLRGRAKEYQLKEKLEKRGYIVFRTSGSHGIADLIAIKPRKDIGTADLWPEVRFIQIKSSIHFKEETVTQKFINHIVIEWHEFPIKTKEFYEAAKKSKRRMVGRKS